MKFSLKIGDLVAYRRWSASRGSPDRLEVDPSGRGCVIALKWDDRFDKELVRVRWLHGQEYWMIADESVTVKLTENVPAIEEFQEVKG